MRSGSMTWALAVMVIGWQGAAAAAVRYEGQARSPADGRLLYREVHWVDQSREVVLYRCPDGKAFARKLLDYAPGATDPDFTLEDARSDERQGVRGKAGAREVFVVSGGKSRQAPLPPGGVVDAGFDAFVRQAWSRLANGQMVEMRFLVPSRLKQMDFKLSQVASDGGKRTFRLAFGAWYGAALPHIDVDYDAGSKRLLAYRGLTDIHDGHGGMVSADITFPATARANVDGGKVAAARAAPLDGRCTQ